jgi:hypothetical protein
MNNHLSNPARCLAVAFFALAGLLAAAAPAQAYVGPGMALGALGAGFGLLMTGLSAVFYLGGLWARRLWRRVTGRVAPAPDVRTEANTVRADP